MGAVPAWRRSSLGSRAARSARTFCPPQSLLVLVLLAAVGLARAFSGSDVTVLANGEVVAGFNVEPRARAQSVCVQLGWTFAATSRLAVAFEFTRHQTYSKGSFWRAEGGPKQEPGLARFPGRAGEVLYRYEYNVTLYADARCGALVAARPFARAPGGPCDAIYCGPGAPCPPGADAGGGEWNYTCADWSQVTVGPYYACPAPPGSPAQPWDDVRSARVQVFLAHAPQDMEFPLRDPPAPRPSPSPSTASSASPAPRRCWRRARCCRWRRSASRASSAASPTSRRPGSPPSAPPRRPHAPYDLWARRRPEPDGPPVAEEERSPDGARVSRAVQADEYEHRDGEVSGASSARFTTASSIRRFRLALGDAGLELQLAQGPPAPPPPSPTPARPLAPRLPPLGYEPGAGTTRARRRPRVRFRAVRGRGARRVPDDFAASVAADGYYASYGYGRRRRRRPRRPRAYGFPPEPYGPPVGAGAPPGYGLAPEPYAGAYAPQPAYTEGPVPYPFAQPASAQPAPGPAATDWPEY
eukprot:tig00001003_g6266.t1